MVGTTGDDISEVGDVVDKLSVKVVDSKEIGEGCVTAVEFT